MIKWKVSFCDAADFLVSTSEQESYSPWAAVMQAMITVDRGLDIRTVLVNKIDAEGSMSDMWDQLYNEGRLIMEWPSE